MYTTSHHTPSTSVPARRRLGRIAAAGVLAGTALLTAAGTATAAPAAVAAPVTLRPLVDQTLVLAVNPTNGVVKPVDPATVGAAERSFTLVPSGDGFSVTVVNSAGATRCLDTVNAANPSLVFAGTCDGSAEQRWIVEPSFSGKRFKNLAFGTVLTPNLNKVVPAINGVFTKPPATSTPGKIAQAWAVGS